MGEGPPQAAANGVPGLGRPSRSSMIKAGRRRLQEESMHATQDSTEVSIAQYADVLRRRWIWVVMAPLVLVGFTLFSDLRAEPVYSAQVELLLQSKPSENILTGVVSTVDPKRSLQNELRIINSRNVKIAVAEKYGAPIGVSAVAGGEDDVIFVRATANDPDKAAERANLYVETYQTARVSTLLDDLAQTQKLVQQQVDDYQAQIEKLDQPLAALDDQIAATNPEDPRYDELVANRQRVKERTDASRSDAQSQLADYQNRLRILQLSEKLTTTGGVQILNPAVPPKRPISPTIMRDVIQSLIVGLFLGIALAFARDQMDDSIRGKYELERATNGLPTLAMIPDDPAARAGATLTPVTVADPMSAGAEAYRGLRTSIQYAQIDRPLSIIQVTTANAGEGKTTTASNLAVAFAQTGQRVIVVGCDLRRPQLHNTLKVDGELGLTSVVLGYETLEGAIQTSPLHPNVDVLASGPLPPNPSELLSHERTVRILNSLAERYAYVFIDCPPVLPVTDSLVLARNVDATIFLARASATSRRSVRRAIEMLNQVDSPLIGAVLTGVTSEETYGSYYEYYGWAKRSRFPFLGRFGGRVRYVNGPVDRSMPPPAKTEGSDDAPGEAPDDAPNDASGLPVG